MYFFLGLFCLASVFGIRLSLDAGKEDFNTLSKRGVQQNSIRLPETLGASFGGGPHFYTVPVGIGTPRQTLNLLFDTGSSTFTVLWKGNCNYCPNSVCSSPPVACPSASGGFDPSTSSTFSRPMCDTTACACTSLGFCEGTSGYGAGVMIGDVSTDIAFLDNLSTISPVPLLLVAQSSVSIILDGVFGVGFDAGNTLGGPTALESLIKANGLAYQFTVTLNLTGGSVYIGGVDPTLDPTSLLHPVSSALGQDTSGNYPAEFFATSLTKIELATPNETLSGSFNLVTSSPGKAFLDTGTPGFSFPTTLLNMLVQQLQTYCQTQPTLLLCGTTNLFNVPQGACQYASASDISALPSIFFTFNDPLVGSPLRVELPPTQWLIIRTTTAQDRTNLQYCVLPNIEDGGSSPMTFGTAFHRAQSVFVNRETNVLSFYKNPTGFALPPPGTGTPVAPTTASPSARSSPETTSSAPFSCQFHLLLILFCSVLAFQ